MYAPPLAAASPAPVPSGAASSVEAGKSRSSRKKHFPRTCSPSMPPPSTLAAWPSKAAVKTCTTAISHRPEGDACINLYRVSAPYRAEQQRQNPGAGPRAESALLLSPCQGQGRERTPLSASLSQEPASGSGWLKQLCPLSLRCHPFPLELHLASNKLEEIPSHLPPSE